MKCIHNQTLGVIHVKNATNIQKINYSNQITKLNKEEQCSIDLVFIDGRFHVAC
jgi:hypothetical protein